jgi:hypothetical protein
VRIGVGGYLFRFNGICQHRMKAELLEIRKPFEKSTILKKVNMVDSEQIFKNLIKE